MSFVAGRHLINLALHFGPGRAVSKFIPSCSEHFTSARRIQNQEPWCSGGEHPQYLTDRKGGVSDRLGFFYARPNHRPFPHAQRRRARGIVPRACELLKKHDRDWHDLVEAIERADILADPVSARRWPKDNSNKWIADTVLKKLDRLLDEAHKAFLQQVMDQPSRHDPATTYAATTDIIAQATAHRRAKRRRWRRTNKVRP
jgi:hypothetical protein